MPEETIEKWGDEIVNKEKKHSPDMLTETRDILRKFYEPYNLRLAKLLQDEDYTWTSNSI